MKQDQTYLPKGRRNKRYSSKRNETLKEMLTRRNFYLIKIFRDSGHQVVLKGNAEKPEIIVDNKIKLSAYVHNFELRLTDRPYNGDIICRVKLNASNNISTKFLELYLKEVDHLPAKKKRKRITKIEPVKRYCRATA